MTWLGRDLASIFDWFLQLKIDKCEQSGFQLGIARPKTKKTKVIALANHKRHKQTSGPIKPSSRL